MKKESKKSNEIEAQEVVDDLEPKKSQMKKKTLKEMINSEESKTDQEKPKKSKKQKHEEIETPEANMIKETEIDSSNKKSKKKSNVYKVLISCLIWFMSSVFVMIIYYNKHSQDKVVTKTLPSNPTTKPAKFCKMIDFAGDGFCDNETNNELCEYDRGDCCDISNDRSQCQECFCYTPKIELGDCSTYEHACWYGYTDYFGFIEDGICDDFLNKKECYFDGGDCCLEEIENAVCDKCTCIQSNLTCIQDELGDGICQDYNNFAMCDYDLDDCCPEGYGTAHRNSYREDNECCDCLCKHKKDLIGPVIAPRFG